MKAFVVVTGGVLLVGGCDRTPQPAREQSRPFSEFRTKLAAEARSEPVPDGKAPLTNQQMDRRDELVKVAALRHGGLVMLSDLKRKLWYSYVFEQWDQILMPEKSQEEKVDIELGLKRRDDRTDAEHYREMIALAYCKISSEASQLDKEAEALFQKWYDRFPDGSAGVPTPAELQQMDREVESLLARVKVLPKLTSEQIETEITALPPRDLRTIVR